LTNRQIIIERGWGTEQEKAIALNDFDDIKIETKSGQEWYDAGDLVFLRQSNEVFRLEGVSRPEPFLQGCMKAQQAFCSVDEIRREQAQPLAS
jgi:hypothetical protein